MIFVATDANAQEFSVPNIVGSYNNANVILNSTKETWAADECIKEGVWSVDCSPSTNQKSENPKARSTIADLEFSPSKSLRKKFLDQFVQKTRTTDPVGAEKMQQLFASTDVIGEIGKGIAFLGLETDNVADAYTVYWMTAWEAADGAKTNFDFSRPQAQAVKQQAASALLKTPEFIGATDAVKQEIAEAYLVQAALIQATSDVAKTDPKLKAGFPSAVRKGAKASGLDLDAMTLTSEGFVPSGKSGDARDSGPDAKDEALAANDNAVGDDGDKTTTYALIAAAGGAGAAAVFGLGKIVGRRG